MTGFEATRQLIEILEAEEIPYLVAGSLSSSAYGIPRSTKDADLVLSVDANGIDRMANRLGPEFILDPQVSFESVTCTLRYIVNIPSVPFKVELFLLSDDEHDQERFQRRQRVSTPHIGEVWLPTAEDVIVMKLRWAKGAARGKDWDDVQAVVAVQGDALDWPYLHKWTERHGTQQLLAEIRESIPA